MSQGLFRGTDRRSRRRSGRIAGFALIVAVAVGLAAPIQGAPAAAEPDTELETVRVGHGDSLSVLLNKAGVSANDAHGIARALQRKTNLLHMRVGREVRLLFRTEDERRTVPLAVSVETGRGRFVEATRIANGGYRARRTSLPLTRPIPLSEVAFDRDGRTVTVRRNQTISGILRHHGVAGATVDAVVGALRAAFDPRDLMPGHAISIAAGRDADGAPLLRGIALHLEDDEAVAVVRTDGGGFAARRTTGAALRDAGPAPVAVAAAEGTAVQHTAAEDAAMEDAAVAPQAPAGDSAESGDDAAPLAAPRADESGHGAGTPEPSPKPIELRRTLHTLHAGSTLMDLLRDADVRRPEADALVQSLRRVFSPRRLPAGITVRVTKRPLPGFEPRIARLDIELPKGRRIEVERGDKGRFESRITTVPPHRPAKPAADRAGPPAVAAAVALETLPPSAKRITVRSGDTLMAILRRHGIDRVEADRAIQAARTLVNLRRLRIGQKITLLTGTDRRGANTLEAVALRVGDNRFVKVTRSAGGHFEAVRVSRLVLTEPPLQHMTTAGSPPEGERPHDPATQPTPAGGLGEVMSGAFVAAAAPIAAPAAVRPALATGAVNGTVNGFAAGLMDGEDGLVRKAVVIRKGDTLSVALTRAGGTRAESEAAIVAFRKVHNPRRLRIGQRLSLSFDPANGSNGSPRLAAFALGVAPDRDVVVTRGDDGIYLPSVVDRPLDRIIKKTVGAIETSLYEAALAAGMPNQVFMEMLHIFSYDIDFQRDIRPGNRFEVLYEAAYDMAGESVENGPLLYARLEVGKRTIELFRYEPEEGPADHLDTRGASVRKALMRTPINGARLSSSFGPRLHPILGYNKKHLGLDFAAPTGTPIFAAGDGTISRIGRAGNYGKYVRIRHNGTYSTGYAHLSGYAKGMKKGKRVRQGQVIAYVGSTGMSTGPHLHYEVMQGNKRINPLKLKLPTGRKLKGRELAAFRQQVQKITVLLAEVPALTRVARR